MYVGATFFKTKIQLFEQLTGNKWRIKFFGSAPVLHTLREFNEAEAEDKLNHGLKGVRTFWFGANHWRGFPEMNLNGIEGVSDTQGLDTSDYNDWAWVPKRQLP